MNEDLTNILDDNDEEAVTITLTYEDGTEEECIVLDIFSVEELGEQEYVALLSLPEGFEDAEEDDEIETDVMLYRYQELEDEEINLEAIEDEDELATVQQAFETLLEEEAEEDDEA